MLIILQIILLILKLAHVVGWSWWIITLPLWILPAAYLSVAGTFFLGVFGYFLAMLVWDKHKQTRLTRRGYGPSY